MEEVDSREALFRLARLGEGERAVFLVRDRGLLLVSRYEGDRYKLAFVDVGVEVRTDVCPGDPEEATTLVGVMEDVPWQGLALEYAMALAPANCENGVLRANPTVKFTVPPEWLMFDLVAVAHALMARGMDEYLEEVSRRLGTRLWVRKIVRV